MKTLVVGGGSIGARHLRNLSSLAAGPLALVEPEAERGRALAGELGAAWFPRLEEGLGWGPAATVVASPSHLHVSQALAAARAGSALFIEKPLAHTPDGLDDLTREVRERRLVSLVGCNMRFHPGPAQVKALLEQGAVGRVLFARIHTGSYFPSWRPAQDYRQNYGARAALGGGCLLDCVHEIDLARWYLGDPEQVFCMAAHLSSLEIDVEDVAALVCRHAGGVLSEIHLDYVQRTYERGCQIVGEQGSLAWDYRAGTVRLYDAARDATSTFAQPAAWEPNRMYLDEMRHFLACAASGCDSRLPIAEALRVMEIVFAAKASAASGRAVALTVAPRAAPGATPGAGP